MRGALGPKGRAGLRVGLWVVCVSSPSPDSLADSLETSTDREAKKKGSEEGGPSQRPEERGDRPQPRVQVSP